MASWLNHVTQNAPRNGTTNHTIDPSSPTDVDAGAAFTPTSGTLLVCVVEGSVTSSTPTGWTLPTGGSAVNNTGLYVWWKVAAGGDTFTTTHGSSDYQVSFDIYEFVAGSTFVSATSATGVANGGAGPTLSGLTGTNQLFAAMGCGTIHASPDFVCDWSDGVEVVETDAPGGSGVTDGYGYGITFLQNSANTSWSATATYSINTQGASTVERLVFAVALGADQGDPVLLAPLVVVV